MKMDLKNIFFFIVPTLDATLLCRPNTRSQTECLIFQRGVHHGNYPGNSLAPVII